jgi:hypothetical protein
MLALRRLAATRAVAVPVRALANNSQGGHAKDHKGFGAREDAIENKYFNQQDKLALEGLLKKLKHHTEPENHVHHTATLEEIFEYHGVPLSGDLRKDLLAWKAGYVQARQ